MMGFFNISNEELFNKWGGGIVLKQPTTLPEWAIWAFYNGGVYICARAGRKSNIG